MGLDQYLLAKFKEGKKVETDNLTGACGGLFGIAPRSDKTEIGYWRKFYKLDGLVEEYYEENLAEGQEGYETMNCKDIELSKKFCQEMMDYAKEEIAEIIEWHDGEPEEDNEDYWNLRDWESTAEIFEKAIKLIDEEDAKIFYKYWR